MQQYTHSTVCLQRHATLVSTYIDYMAIFMFGSGTASATFIIFVHSTSTLFFIAQPTSSLVTFVHWCCIYSLQIPAQVRDNCFLNSLPLYTMSCSKYVLFCTVYCHCKRVHERSKYLLILWITFCSISQCLTSIYIPERIYIPRHF